MSIKLDCGTSVTGIVQTGLVADSYLLPSESHVMQKTQTKIKNPAPISFRYCPLIRGHYKWGRR